MPAVCIGLRYMAFKVWQMLSVHIHDLYKFYIVPTVMSNCPYKYSISTNSEHEICIVIVQKKLSVIVQLKLKLNKSTGILYYKYKLYKHICYLSYDFA